MEYISASSQATPNWMGQLICHPGGKSCRSDRCYQNAELTKNQKHNSELGTEQPSIEAGGWLARKQLCRKGTAVPVDKRLTGNQQSIVAATATCRWAAVGSTVLLLTTQPGKGSVLGKHYWENCVHYGHPTDKRKDTTASLGERYNMVWELRHLTFKDRLKGRSLLVMEKRRLRVDLTAVFNHLKGNDREDRSILFSKCTGKGQEATHTRCGKRNSTDTGKFPHSAGG